MSWHPRGEQLRAFAGGEGSEADFDRIEAHVHDCPQCLQALEELGESRSVQVVIEAIANPPTGLPALAAADTPNTPDTALGSMPARDTDIMEPSYPKRLGPYELQSVIGEGGMGVVFLASQIQPVARQVALKVMKTGLAQRDAVRRFEFERQTLASLDHPGIARLLEAGESEGYHYFAMELINGQALTAYCDAHRLSINARLQLLIQVCETIQFAHRKAVIHRDLKPSNILVATLGNAPQHKIIDFGIAKSIDQANPLTAMTQCGQVLGTWQYMSPEQLSLDPADIDTRSDVYALGSVLYELLCGSPPLDLSGERRSQIDAICRAIREHEPLLVSQQLSESDDLVGLADCRCTSPSQLVRQVSGELDWITQTALAKDPDERYQSASALAEDLDRFLRNVPLRIRSPSRWVALQKFMRRHRGSLVTTALVLFVVFLGIGSYAWQLWQTMAVNREMEARAYVAEIQLANAFYRQGNFDRTLSLLAGCTPRPGRIDYRGWEWRHLHKLCKPEELDDFSFQYGAHAIRDIEFSPDGSLVGIAQTSSQCAAVLDVESQEIIAELNCNHQGVAVEFTPDGSLLAVVTQNGEVYLWDYRANEIVFSDQPSKNRLRGVAFHPEGQQFVVCGDTGIHWYDRQDLSVGPFEFFASKRYVTDVNYSPNGKMLIAGDRTESGPKLWAAISLFDTETQEKIGERRVAPDNGTHSTEVRSVEFFHNNEQVLVGLSNGLIAAWKLGQSNPETRKFEFPTLQVFRAQGDGGVYSVKHSAGGEFVAAGASDNRILVWDGRQVLPDGKPMDYPYLNTLRAHSSVIQGLDFCPKTGLLVTADNDALIHFWKPTAKQNMIRTGHDKPHCLALSADARLVAVGTDKGDITCWRTDRLGNGFVAGYSSKTDRVTDVEFLPIEDPSYYHLAAIDLAGRLLLFKVEKGVSNTRGDSELKPQVIDGAFVRCVSDPLESCLWLSGKKGSIFRLQIGKTIGSYGVPATKFSVDPNQQTIPSLELLPRSRMLASVSWNRSVRLTNVRTGETQEILRPEFPVREIAVSPDERYLAICGESRKLLIYDRHTGQRRELLGHSGRVLSVKFSPDGSRLASGAEDLSVRLWDTLRWCEVFSSTEAEGYVKDLEFTADGTQLFIGCSNNKILVLEAPSE